MQLEKPADIEGALAEYLTAKGLAASAPPLAPDYPGKMPCHLVTRTGGSVRTRVIVENSCEVDTYAQTWEEAQASASEALAWIAHAPAETIIYDGHGLPVYTVTTGLPYNNPDPRHPTTPRVTFPCTVTTRAFVEEI